MAVKERSQIKGTDAQIKAFAGHNGVLAFATDTKSLHVLSGTAGTTTEFLPSTKVATKTELANYTPTASLATVATSGSYNDLSDKPSVDFALSSTSENPVQNKVVNSALDGKLSTSGGTVSGSTRINYVSFPAAGQIRTTSTNEELLLNYEQGAWISLLGKDFPRADKGGFIISTSGDYGLTGSPNGALMWGGETVERCLDFSFSGLPENVDDSDTHQGYVKFASGFQMCFGVTRTTKEGRTITFAKPFTVIPAVYASRASALITNGPFVSADTATTTTISICQSFDENLAVAWLAIGR